MGSNLTYCNASTEIHNAHAHRSKDRWACVFYGIIEYILPLRQLLCRLSFYQYRQRGLRLYKILRCPDSPQNDFRSLLTHIIHIEVHNTQLRFNDFRKWKIVKCDNSHIFRDTYSGSLQFIYAAKRNILVCANHSVGPRWQFQQGACGCCATLTGGRPFPQISCRDFLVQSCKCATQTVRRN